MASSLQSAEKLAILAAKGAQPPDAAFLVAREAPLAQLPLLAREASEAAASAQAHERLGAKLDELRAANG